MRYTRTNSALICFDQIETRYKWLIPEARRAAGQPTQSDLQTARADGVALRIGYSDLVAQTERHHDGWLVISDRRPSSLCGR
jgi:hypothetical protein